MALEIAQNHYKSLQNDVFFDFSFQKIWSNQKKAVTLHAFLRECALCTCVKAQLKIIINRKVGRCQEAQ